MKSKREKTEEMDSCNESENQKNENGNFNAEIETNGETAAEVLDESVKNGELEAVRAQLDEKTQKCNEYLNALQRSAAEFDNFKKRTAREKEALYTDAVSDVAAAFLPVIDNLERAAKACSSEFEGNSLKEGVDLVCRQIKDVLKNIGIEEIKSVNESFDPNFHNAVMHIEDDSLGQGVVVEEFQKGYIYKDKVIRHSIVKVAN